MLAWTAALALAVLTGWLQVMFRDLNLALLAAMGFCLALGAIDPVRPWKWSLLIGFAPPVAELCLMLRGAPVQRGSVEVAFGALLPAFVGALGGAAMRSMVERVFEKTAEPTEKEVRNAPESKRVP